MDEALKEQLVARFREYLDRASPPEPDLDWDSESRDPDEPIEAEIETEIAADAPDLFTLLAELAALKNEVKLESRQVKGALDEFRSLFEIVQTSQTRLDEEAKRRRESERRLEQEAHRELLLELLNLRDRLEAGHHQARRFRPGWFGQHRAQAFVGSMAEGLAISLRRLDETLARREVRAFDTLDHRFDPHRMRANDLADDPERPEGVVVEELRKGFLIGDRLLRPAEVRVNRPSRARARTPDKPRLNH
jgi:molecular chaperone GrpE